MPPSPIELSKPFESYVSVEALPKEGDARRFVLHLQFLVQGSTTTREMTWPWIYAATRKAEDRRKFVDELQTQCMREMALFRKHVEYELACQKCRLREIDGALVWAESRIAPVDIEG